MKSSALTQFDSKRKILYFLKVMHEAGLEDLSIVTKISGMAIHKHITDLQDRGLVESIGVRRAVGRPKMQYSLTGTGKTIFPKSYDKISTYAIDFIEKNMGSNAVESVLIEHQKELYEKYETRLKDLDYDN